MKNLISIIVPIYQTEKYISQCIESILNQTYPYWELILINDGSTDRSGMICEKYAGKDKRIKVYHQCNMGVSEARNKGLQMAHGEYVMFVDSDDFLEQNTLSVTINLSIAYKLSILQFGIRSFKEQSNSIIPEKEQYHFKLYSNLNNYHSFQYGVWGYLIHHDIYHHIRFSKEVHYAEDIEYITKCLIQSYRLGVISKIFYHQRLHTQSAMANLNSYEKVIDHLTVIRHLHQLSQGKKQYVIDFINLQIIRLVKAYISYFIKNPIKKENVNKVNKDFRSIFHLINADSLREKIIFTIAYIDIRIYIGLLKLYTLNNIKNNKI